LAAQQNINEAIRLLLIALFLIGGYKLLEREIYGASANTEVSTAVAPLQTELATELPR